jgi:choice-of-anchor A domain-containing protein
MPRNGVQNRKMPGSQIATAVAFALYAMISASGAHAQSTEISSLSQLLGTSNGTYNAYVLGDIGSSSAAYTSDSSYAIAAGGNVYLTSFSAGTNGSGVSVVSGGNVTISNGSTNGSIDAGGNIQITGATVNGSAQAKGTVTVTNASQPSSTVQGSSAATPINFTALAADTKSEAISIASLATQAQSSGTAGTVSGTNNLVLTGTAAGVNYFNLTAAQMAQLSSGSLTIDNTVAGATDIISVTGSAVTVGAPGNFSFNYEGTASAANTLFDFSQASSLTISNAFDASILAPTATVAFTNGNLTGTLVAGNLASTTYQDGEFHAGTFSGVLPTASPAPMGLFGSSPLVGLVLAAVLVVGLYRRRRPAVAA